MSVELLEVQHNKAAAGTGAAPARGFAGDPDGKLVAAARAGDRSAFDQLVSRHERKILRVVQNITRNVEDAEDVLQSAFIQAYTHLDRFQGDSRFSTWLTRIAINQALMALRRRRPGHFSLDELDESADHPMPREIVDWGPNPEQRYSQVELREILQRAMARLNPSRRIVFQLRDVEELSLRETSQALSLSITAVKSRLHRARLELREILNQCFQPATQGREAHA